MNSLAVSLNVASMNYSFIVRKGRTGKPLPVANRDRVSPLERTEEPKTREVQDTYDAVLPYQGNIGMFRKPENRGKVNVHA